jgi:hypothetical protein
MSVILLMLGILVAAAGTLAIGFGIPIYEFTLGTTLIIAGTAALTGGLVLIGLSAVVSELGRVAEALRTRAVPRPAARPAEAQEAPTPTLTQPLTQPLSQPTPPVEAPAAAARVPAPQRPRPEAPGREARPAEPYPAGPSAVEVSAAAIERLRSSIPRTERPRADVVDDIEEVPPLSPNGASHHPAQQARAAGEAPPVEPRVAADDRAGGEAPGTLKASRLDFLFRSRAAARAAPAPQPPAPPPENFDSFWPADGRPGRSAEPQPRIDEIQRHADYPPAQPQPQPQPAHERPAQERPAPSRPEPAAAETAAILKSGVVDGMAYTLYADGSIEAKLPHGTVRFGSIAELRAHIENSS